MTQKEFTEAIKYMADCYRAEMTSGTVAAWYPFFKDYPFEVMQQAVKNCILKLRYMPTVADLRGEIAEMKEPILTTSAIEEWETVQRAVRKYGQAQAEEGFNSLLPITQKAVANMGGFREVCLMKNDEWTRRLFERVYKEYQDMARAQVIRGEKRLSLIKTNGEKELKICSTTEI